MKNLLFTFVIITNVVLVHFSTLASTAHHEIINTPPATISLLITQAITLCNPPPDKNFCTCFKQATEAQCQTQLQNPQACIMEIILKRINRIGIYVICYGRYKPETIHPTECMTDFMYFIKNCPK